jgi:hypothetical protein
MSGGGPRDRVNPTSSSDGCVHLGHASHGKGQRAWMSAPNGIDDDREGEAW